MTRMIEMDQNVTVMQQLSDANGAVTLINTFTVAPEDVEQFLSIWAEDAAYFKRQPGYINAQLHRGIAGSCVFLNVAVWESVEHFRRAFTNPEFRAKLERYPASAVTSPHLFRKIAVQDICIA